MYEKITVANVNMFAIKHYDNPHCESEAEFNDDMKRFKYIKRLLRKYHETGILKERLLLNHLIVIKNLFGPEIKLLNDDLIISILKKELFHLMLQKSLFRDMFLEKFLYKVRKEFLILLNNNETIRRQNSHYYWRIKRYRKGNSINLCKARC